MFIVCLFPVSASARQAVFPRASHVILLEVTWL
jgi:hypothetical protein